MENRFKRGEIVYSIESDGKGGAIIEYHEVLNTATLNKMVTVQVLGGEPLVESEPLPAINTDKMTKDEYKYEINFFTFDELRDNLGLFLNKKKLY